MTAYKTIGRPQPLKDGKEKVSGELRYATDVKMPGMLYGRLVTSPYAHARVLGIDREAALDVSGVVRVLTAADLPHIPPSKRQHLLLARDRVIFNGHPVALVLAESEGAAADGAQAVSVDYDPLPAAATVEQALAEDAPLVWPEGVPSGSEEGGAHGADVGADEEEENAPPTNVSGERSFERGDVAAGFAAADVIVERTFTTPGVHQSYLEPHATLVQPDPVHGGATVWTSTQAPFYVREEVAGVLGVPESDVRVVPTPVGGAFGGKFVLYEPLVALAARITGRPVRLILTRLEEMLAANPALPSRIRVKVGAQRDGSLTALEADLIFDAGCYPGAPYGIAAYLLGSAYRVPNLDIQAHEVLTFKPSTGAYRAPGAPQAFYALESAIDELARLLEIDPLALRLQNAARTGDEMAGGRPWPSMGMKEVLEALAEHPAWKERDAARAAGRGVGVAVGGWPGGTQPAAAACRLNRDGLLQVHVGSVDLTGTSTGFALLAAEAFGVTPEQVRVVNDDTASAPYAGAAGGSKITYTVGPAVIEAAEEARAQVLEVAAEEFEASPADLEIVDGFVQVRGVPDRRLSLGEIARETMRFGGRHRPIMGRGRHADTTRSPGFCAQLAEVEVDEETGHVRVVRQVLVQDVGRAINPLTVRGQMMGGATQGLGWAMYELLAYDEQGQLLSGSWTDYGVPHFDQAAPSIETVIVEVPSDHGPYGARGVGEPPVIATAAAVANAIADAAGVRLTALPMTPPRVLEGLQLEGVQSEEAV